MKVTRIGKLRLRIFDCKIRIIVDMINKLLNDQYSAEFEIYSSPLLRDAKYVLYRRIDDYRFNLYLNIHRYKNYYTITFTSIPRWSLGYWLPQGCLNLTIDNYHIYR